MYFHGSRCKGFDHRRQPILIALRSGGRRLAVRKMIECHISAQPRTPFPASRDFPSRGNERYEGKKQRVIYFRYHFGVFPLWWLAPPPCTVGSMSYDTESKSVTLALYSSPDRAIPQPSARRAVKLTNPPAVRPVHLKNLSLHNLSTQPAAVRRPQPSGRRPVNPHARRALSLFFY